MEIAPGIHRIESTLGVRFMAQYVLAGDARTLLVDTGMSDTPAEVIGPYLESVGLGLEAIDEVIISHADLDHSGGNRSLRELHPRVRIACHELDRRWIESNEAMVAENYLWHEEFGFEQPDEAARAELKASCGGDCRSTKGSAAARRCASATTGASRCSTSRATRSATSGSGIRAAARRSSSTRCSSAASTRATASC